MPRVRRGQLLPARFLQLGKQLPQRLGQAQADDLVNASRLRNRQLEFGGGGLHGGHDGLHGITESAIPIEYNYHIYN